MSDVLYRATKYMNTEDTLMAQKKSLRKGKDKRTYGRIRGGRWLRLENDERTGAPSPP